MRQSPRPSGNGVGHGRCEWRGNGRVPRGEVSYRDVVIEENCEMLAGKPNHRTLSRTVLMFCAQRELDSGSGLGQLAGPARRGSGCFAIVQ